MAYTQLYAKTLAEGAQGIWNWYVTNVTANPSAFTAVAFSWNSRGGLGPYVLQLDTTPDTASAQMNCFDVQWWEFAPMRYWASQMGQIGPFYMSGAVPASGIGSMDPYFWQLCDSISNAMANLDGSETITQAAVIPPLFGASQNQAVIVSILFTDSNYDWLWVNLVVIDPSQYDPVYGAFTPNYPSLLPQVIPSQSSGGGAVTVNVGPPLDVDLRVDQLQGYISTVSKTTTISGP